jgi:hypothetical protein
MSSISIKLSDQLVTRMIQLTGPDSRNGAMTIFT